MVHHRRKQKQSQRAADFSRAWLRSRSERRLRSRKRRISNFNLGEHLQRLKTVANRDHDIGMSRKNTTNPTILVATLDLGNEQTYFRLTEWPVTHSKSKL